VNDDLWMDFAAVVRSSLEAGATPDQIAKTLIEDHHLLPISAIKALRSGSSLNSDEAKEVVQRNLPVDQWAAAEALWEMIASAEASVEGE
jgi:hypothetical protein